MADKAIVPRPSFSLIEASEVPQLLRQIRPEWQARNLIARVHRLISVDPSSACQRLFNAAIHDLREKITIAGLDIAKEAAIQNKLPPITNAEDVETYSTAKTIDLAYRIGLLTRPEWRRLSRCYEIRRDLEHEDNEYEAGVEDCVYIFKTCIEAVLAVDPVHLLRVTDVKQLVEQATPVVPAESLISDYSHAPQARQEVILKFLVSNALNAQQSDIVQQNAFTFLVHLQDHTHDTVRLSLAKDFQDRVGRDALDLRHARVAIASGAFPYLRKGQIADFFDNFHRTMQQLGYDWRSYAEHGELLRTFVDVGAFQYAPSEQRKRIVKWMVLAYVGESGGLTRYGHVRQVFYSDTAAPIIYELFEHQRYLVAQDILDLRDDKSVRAATSDPHVRRRFEQLIDITDIEEASTTA